MDAANTVGIRLSSLAESGEGQRLQALLWRDVDWPCRVIYWSGEKQMVSPHLLQ